MKTIQKVGIFVIRNNPGHAAELLLFTHVDYPDAPIQIPGGTIEAGEDPYAAAQRELKEESGLSGLPLIRYLGISETISSADTKTVLQRHYYLLDGTGIGDHWIHIVDGGEEDTGLRFEYRWHNIPLEFRLANDLGYFLNSAAIPELFYSRTSA